MAVTFEELKKNSKIQSEKKPITFESLQSKKIKEECERTAQNPDAKEIKKLNAYLMWIIVLFGNTVPFSSFERSKIWIRLKSLRQRFECCVIFAAASPPEQDDAILLKIELTIKSENYNATNMNYKNK